MAMRNNLDCDRHVQVLFVKLPNPVRQKLLAGEPSFGSFLNLVSPMAAEVLIEIGYEWLAVDAEHAQWDMGSMTEAFRAIEAHGGVPMTRVQSHDPVVLAQTLDAGAMGIIVPHVSTVEQAEAIAQACRYPPRGQRSIGSARATITRGQIPQMNDEILVCPQIEDMEGVNNIEAIMAVDGMDVAFIGPSDLAASMGLESSDLFVHKDHVAAIDAILAGAKANGKPAGTPIGDVAKARKLMEQGFTFIDFGNDTNFMSTSATDVLGALQA